MHGQQIITFKLVQNPSICITGHMTAEKETKVHEGMLPYITLPGIMYYTRRNTVES